MEPGTVRQEKRDALLAGVAGLGAMLIYVLTTGTLSFLLDSSELVTVARLGGTAHPPGSPLYTALGGFLTSLPLGSIPFRVHLFSALFGAISASLLFLVGARLLERAERPELGWRLIMVLVSWSVALSPALWFQSVRAEVYTLTSAINLGLVYLALVWSGAPDRLGPGLLMALLGGLGLSNHHYLTGLTGLACLVYLLTVPGIRRQLFSYRLGLLAAFLFAGLAVYLYLPIRAHQGWLWWGDPGTAGGLLRMVSAQAFHSAVTEMPKAPFGEALVIILVKWVELLGAPLFLAGLAGVVLLFLTVRREALLVLLVVLAGLFAKAIMYLDVENPDDHAYFAIGLQGLAAGTVGIAAFLGRVEWGRLGSKAVVGAMIVVGGLISWGGASLAMDGAARWTMRGFVAPDVLNRHLLGSVSPGALYMPSYYATWFNTFYYHEVEKRRPDVALLQAGFQSKYDGGRPYSQDVMERYEELRPTLEHYLSSELFPLKSLEELRSQRDVVFESNVLKADGPEWAEYSLGENGLPVAREKLAFTGAGLRLTDALEDSRKELETQHRYWVSLYKELGNSPLHWELKKTLSYMHYRNAIYFINRSSWFSAHLEVTMALRHYPEMDRLVRLEAALKPLADVEKNDTLRQHCQPLLPDPEPIPFEVEVLGM